METVLGAVKDISDSQYKSFLLLLFVCEKVNQSRHEHHDDLGHDDEFNKEHAVEETLWLDRERQAVDVVQPHG